MISAESASHISFLFFTVNKLMHTADMTHIIEHTVDGGFANK